MKRRITASALAMVTILTTGCSDQSHTLSGCTLDTTATTQAYSKTQSWMVFDNCRMDGDVVPTDDLRMIVDEKHRNIIKPGKTYDMAIDNSVVPFSWSVVSITGINKTPQ